MGVRNWSRSLTNAPALAFLFATMLAGAGSSCVGCATTHANYDYASEPDPRKLEYQLGPSDVVHITVWHNPDLSGESVVRPDGTITLPLIGDLRAAGRTPGQLRTEIAQRLSTFLKEDAATVTVAVTSINSYRFTVSGNVDRPGAYTANHYVTVSEAITLAGGPNKFGSPEEMVIIRPDPAKGAYKRIPVDYTSILNGSHPEQDLPLLAGDTIYVP
jgi:polysaccharide export outer membrane protein